MCLVCIKTILELGFESKKSWFTSASGGKKNCSYEQRWYVPTYMKQPWSWSEVTEKITSTCRLFYHLNVFGFTHWTSSFIREHITIAKETTNSPRRADWDNKLKEMWDHFVTHLQALFTGAPVCQSPHFLDQNALFYSQCFSHWLCRVTVCNTLHGHGRLESIIDKDCFFFHCHVGMHVSPSTSVPLYLLFSSFLLKYIYIYSLAIGSSFVYSGCVR